MYYYNDSKLTSNLLNAIFTGDLDQISELLNAHPELISTISPIDNTATPLMKTIEMALLSRNVLVLQKIVGHGAQIKDYHGDLINKMLIDTEYTPIDIFKFIISELLKDYDEEQRNALLQKTFAILVQYGNYPRCKEHVDFLFSSGLQFHSEHEYPNQEIDSVHQQVANTHVRMVLEAVADDFTHEYEEQTKKILAIAKKIPALDITERNTNFFKYEYLIAYLNTYDLNPADVVLNKFIHIISKFNKIKEILSQSSSPKGHAFLYKILARIYNLLRRANISVADELLQDILSKPVYDRISFIIEVVRDQLPGEDLEPVVREIHLSFTYKEYKSIILTPQLATKFLEILIVFNIYQADNIAAQRIHRMAITEKLLIIRDLLQPSLATTNLSPSAIIHSFKFRKLIVTDIVERISSRDTNTLIYGDIDEDEVFPNERNSSERLAILIENHRSSWLTPKLFEEKIITPLIGTIDIDNIVDNSEEIAYELAKYFNILLHFNRQDICEKIIATMDKAGYEYRIIFCQFLLSNIINQLALWLTTSKEIKVIATIKDLIIKNQQGDMARRDLEDLNKLHYLDICSISLQHTVYKLRKTNPDNMQGILAIYKEIIEKIITLFSNLEKSKLEQTLLHSFNTIAKTLNYACKLMMRHINTHSFEKIEDAIKLMQLFTNNPIAIADFLKSLSSYNKESIYPSIKILERILIKTIRYIYTNINDIEDIEHRKVLIKEALVFTLLIPKEYISQQLTILRALLISEIVKEHQLQGPSNVKLLETVKQNTDFPTYFNAVYKQSKIMMDTVLAADGENNQQNLISTASRPRI